MAVIGIHHFFQVHIFSNVRLGYCLFPFSYCFPDTHVFPFLILSRVFIFLNQVRTLTPSDIVECFLSETSFNVTDLQWIFYFAFISTLQYWVKLQLYYSLQCLILLIFFWLIKTLDLWNPYWGFNFSERTLDFKQDF